MIVSRDRRALFDVLDREFAEDREKGEIEVILDRRRGERRAGAELKRPDRRRTDRRVVALSDLRSLGWAIASQAGAAPRVDGST